MPRPAEKGRVSSNCSSPLIKTVLNRLVEEARAQLAGYRKDERLARMTGQIEWICRSSTAGSSCGLAPNQK